MTYHLRAVNGVISKVYSSTPTISSNKTEPDTFLDDLLFKEKYEQIKVESLIYGVSFLAFAQVIYEILK